MATERRVSKQEWMYGILRNRILDGTYGPGHPIVIDALAREFKISQMPVREAIRRLEAEQWVVYQRNQGARVASPDWSEWIDTIVTLAVLQGFASRQAAPHIRSQDIDRLRASNESMRSAIRALDIASVLAHNFQFHDVIHKRCPNAYLRSLTRATAERVHQSRVIYLGFPGRGQAAVDEHERLIEMLERGDDEEAIERVAREHELQTAFAARNRRPLGAGLLDVVNHGPAAAGS
jgi:DNA-binding GntR family transcriptional regulator